MADANERDFAESGEPGAAAAVVVSPLLNLAPSCASGPTVKQSRPVLSLGTSSVTGTATLSLAPDRKNVDVSVHLDGAAVAGIQLRRVASHHLHGASGCYEYDLLIIEITTGGPALQDSGSNSSFSLADRNAFLPFERVSELRKSGVMLSELVASSIDGLQVEGAREAGMCRQGIAAYFAERMTMEIKAAERSTSAIAACRHVELANLYARQLHS